MAKDGTAFESLLAGVEKDKNGSPIVLSRYGLRIAKVEGRSYLIAMTARDLAEVIAKRDGLPLADVLAKLELTSKWCLVSTFDCHPEDECHTGCHPEYDGATKHCYCNS